MNCWWWPTVMPGTASLWLREIGDRRIIPDIHCLTEL